MVKAELQNGNTVGFRSSGWSLYPRVCSGDSCTYQPVANADDEIQLDDIVFCEVQPGNRFYAHVVKKICDWGGVVHVSQLRTWQAGKTAGAIPSIFMAS